MTTITNTGPMITSGDRMSFSVFLAAAFHALVLLGIGFAMPERSKPDYERTIDVTLATEFSEERPDEADFLGQADQLGGGDLEEAARLSTNEVALFPDQNIQELTIPEQEAVTRPKVDDQTLITTTNSNQPTPNYETQPEDETEAFDSVKTQSLYNKSLEMASLAAQLETEKQFNARQPRKRQVSAAIHRASDALYLDAWRRKIEKIGNLNYPERAKRESIYGSLTLKVALNKNGSVNEISVLRSSGHKLLDDAAIRIVRMASPFAPLTPEMLVDTDILEIVRVWQFQPDNSMNTN